MTLLRGRNLSLSLMPNAKACAGPAVHSSIFLAQYMRMKPCILPSATICRCAPFHSASCVFACSSCSYVYMFKLLQNNTAGACTDCYKITLWEGRVGRTRDLVCPARAAEAIL